MIEAIVAILCGLILAANVFPGGKIFSALIPFKTLIGIVALVVGVLNITSIIGISLIIAGLVLTINSIKTVPLVGRYLKQIGQVFVKFKTIIGVFLLIIGIIEIIEIIS
jgi:hypothetical protein